ncbi:MAG: hypothetical protein NTY47_08775 [Candidatus Omnitrophica bacterium]|nr:hypothetical protein [Candidatus Omnitrophota bacterium]
MGKKQIEIGVTLILVVIFIAALANSCKAVGNKMKNKPAPVSQNMVTPKQDKSPVKVSAIVAIGHYTEDSEWERDPFSGRLYSAERKTSALHLIGIIWDKKEPLAMINDRILKAGDMIQGKLILKINSDSIVVDDGSKETEIKLQQ